MLSFSIKLTPLTVTTTLWLESLNTTQIEYQTVGRRGISSVDIK